MIVRVDEHFLSIKEALFIFDHIFIELPIISGHQFNICTKYRLLRLLRLLRLYSYHNQNFPDDECVVYLLILNTATNCLYDIIIFIIICKQIFPVYI